MPQDSERRRGRQSPTPGRASISISGASPRSSGSPRAPRLPGGAATSRARSRRRMQSGTIFSDRTETASVAAKCGDGLVRVRIVGDRREREEKAISEALEGDDAPLAKRAKDVRERRGESGGDQGRVLRLEQLDRVFAHAGVRVREQGNHVRSARTSCRSRAADGPLGRRSAGCAPRGPRRLSGGAAETPRRRISRRARSRGTGPLRPRPRRPPRPSSPRAACRFVR